MSKKKKIIIISVMVMLLVVTGVLNIVLNGKIEDTQTTTATVTNANFFTTYKSDRTSTRNQEISYYDAIIASTTSSQDAIKVAESKRLDIIGDMEKELVVEALIKAQGFEDCIVTTTTNNVNVVVKSADLSSNQVAQIVSIVREQTGVSADNIKIIEVN